MFLAKKEDRIYQIPEGAAEKYSGLGFDVYDKAGKLVLEAKKAAPKKRKNSRKKKGEEVI